MPKFALAVSIDFEDGVDMDAERLAAIVNAAVLQAIPDLGDRAPTVDTVPAVVPRVLITVSGGVAELVAVDGTAAVNVVDYDNAEDMDESVLEEALAFPVKSGNAKEMDDYIQQVCAELSVHVLPSPKI